MKTEAFHLLNEEIVFSSSYSLLKEQILTCMENHPNPEDFAFGINYLHDRDLLNDETSSASENIHKMKCVATLWFGNHKLRKKFNELSVDCFSQDFFDGLVAINVKSSQPYVMIMYILLARYPKDKLWEITQELERKPERNYNFFNHTLLPQWKDSGPLTTIPNRRRSKTEEEKNVQPPQGFVRKSI